MQKKAPYTGQPVRWLGGLVAAWLMLASALQTADVRPARGWQTYLSSIAPWEGTDDSDYSLADSIQPRVALARSVSAFFFGPSVDVLPSNRWIFHQILQQKSSGDAYQSRFAFRFLRIIFEHQIAINAP